MNLQEIINRVKKAFPDAKILLCAMHVPPFYGPVHADRFNALYGELIRENPGKSGKIRELSLSRSF
ncbi:MAG: hypothetical protein V4642_15830, partial [Bacteroidota bacterium]